MRTQKISENRFEHISNAANHGSYTRAEVTLLSPNLHQVEKPSDAHYLVIESAYTITIIMLDATGRPYAILERE